MEESIEVASSTSELKRVPLTRAEFLDLVPPSILGLVLVYLNRESLISAGGQLYEQAIQSAPFDIHHPREHEPLSLYNLDYIERTSPSPRPPLLAFENGHRRYLRNVVLNSPGIRRNIGISLNRMLYDSETPTLRSLFEEHILLAREVLEETEPAFKEVRPDMQFYQAFSMATYSLTAILGAWINMEEFKSMGINFPAEYQYVNRFGISPTYQLWNLFPRIFPAALDKGIDENSYAGLFFGSGTDRSVHLMNHFFLVSRYISLLYSGNQDADRIPEFVKPIVAPFNGALKAKALSFLAGNGWELKETLNDKDIIGNFEKQPGYWDPVVGLDLEANKTGADLAIEVLSCISGNSEKSFEDLFNMTGKIFSKLEEPYYTHPKKLLKVFPYLNWYYSLNL